MLEPTFVIDLARAIVAESDGYARTVAAVRVARDAINKVVTAGRLALSERERNWLKRLNDAVDGLPQTEEAAIENAATQYAHLYKPEAYGLEAAGG